MSSSKYDLYYAYDNPVPYRSLLIYPALMNDYFMFHFCSTCLLLDMRSVPDVNVIRMKYYLEYLYYATNEKTPYALMLKELLKILLHIRDDEEAKKRIFLGYDEQNHPIFKIDNEVYTAEDFEEIKKIIIEQNVLEPPDDTIDKAVRDKLEEALAIKQKMSENKMCSLEDQMICVMISTSLKLEDIYKLSIRKFSKVLERVDHKLHYEIYLSASMSGLVKFDDTSFIKHWMIELKKKGRYDGLLIKNSEAQEKINKVNNAL